VVVARSIGTIPQERYNLRLVEESGVGLVADRWADVPGVVRRLAEAPEPLRQMRARIEALPHNRAVFEVVDLIDRDVAHAVPQSPSRPSGEQ
jgi:UDP-N-acetylglucosamine:LPS N-acetylglucosamine transferase